MTETYDELQQRYIAAIDEINYIAGVFAKRMGMQPDFELASEHINNLICRVEGLLEDLDLMRDDAEAEE